MKTSYYELDEELERGLQRVYLLIGDQDLLRDLAVQKIQTAAVGNEPTPFNSERFDGEEVDADHVLLAANMLPLLGGQRLVAVKRATRLVESSEALWRYVDDPCPHTVLVLDLDKKPDGRRKSWKDLEKRASVIVCDAPRPWELEDWVAGEAGARGLKLGKEEIRYLVAELGSDLRRLLNEIEKLSLYAGGDRLDLETIAEVLGRGKAQSIFKFIDAVAACEAGSALRQLGRLLDEGEAPLRILALLDRLVGQLRLAREAQASGARESNLASLLGVPPSAARTLAQSARRIDARFLERAVKAVADTDRVLKSSRLPDRVVLESLVISLSRRKPGGGTQSPEPEARRRLKRDL